MHDGNPYLGTEGHWKPALVGWKNPALVEKIPCLCAHGHGLRWTMFARSILSEIPGLFGKTLWILLNSWFSKKAISHQASHDPITTITKPSRTQIGLICPAVWKPWLGRWSCGPSKISGFGTWRAHPDTGVWSRDFRTPRVRRIWFENHENVPYHEENRRSINLGDFVFLSLKEFEFDRKQHETIFFFGTGCFYFHFGQITAIPIWPHRRWWFGKSTPKKCLSVCLKVGYISAYL